MEVNEDSCVLPLEGFAVCPNCGADLKRGTFLKTGPRICLCQECSEGDQEKFRPAVITEYGKQDLQLSVPKGNGRLARFHQA
jgi:hypothetical protein